MWYNNKAKIERRVDGGTSESGQPLVNIVTVISSLSCDIQPVSQMVNNSEAGNTVMADKLLLCDDCDIRAGDIITDLDSLEVFRAEGTTKGVLLPHLEVNLKSGVL